jgi:hypothetical protein
MNLRLPSAATRQFSKGDHVNVSSRLTLAETAHGSGPQRAANRRLSNTPDGNRAAAGGSQGGSPGNGATPGAGGSGRSSAR